MNKGFHKLGKINDFRSTRNRCTKRTKKNRVTKFSRILKIVPNLGMIFGKKHNQHAGWLKDSRKQFETVKSMEKVEISQVEIYVKRCHTRKLLEKMVCTDVG